MNFYKRYPADYQRKTARLTLAQHGAYSLLLDEFYTTEEPLPADIDELFRICRAMNKAEQDAVRVIAERFFPVGEDGTRRNSRAEEELAEAAPAVQAARENGRKGGRPKKPSDNPLGYQYENPAGNPVGSENKTQDEPSSKAPHSSELREEKETTPPLRGSPPAGSSTRGSRLPNDWTLDEVQAAFARAEGLPDPAREAQRFRDYWTAQPGQRGVKTDWGATWRNWVRRAAETPAGKRQSRGDDPFAEAH